jgi:hypothetical protein
MQSGPSLDSFASYFNMSRHDFDVIIANSVPRRNALLGFGRTYYMRRSLYEDL